MTEFTALLLAGVIVAAIGGLAYLAYNEPILFKWFYYPFLGISVILFGGITVWDTAITSAVSATNGFAASGKIADFYAAADALSVPFGAAMLCEFLFIAYMALLGILSEHRLGKGESKTPPNRKRKDL